MPERNPNHGATSYIIVWRAVFRVACLGHRISPLGANDSGLPSLGAMMLLFLVLTPFLALLIQSIVDRWWYGVRSSGPYLGIVVALLFIFPISESWAKWLVHETERRKEQLRRQPNRQPAPNPEIRSVQMSPILHSRRIFRTHIWENAVQETVPEAMAPSQARFTEYAAMPLLVDEDSAHCLICYRTWERGDEMLITPCKHRACRSCAEEWFSRVLSCPTCQQKLVWTETLALVETPGV
ncbi:uncharacterized protein HMPREF1541_09704 [Cyphellophora europaea CBS 101466]|uniref:RING-type domain-containing protein n=1 Tax=Cyphellophora europaea (strain CBS 101466) TaxID=1220924 RepID=W2SA96_CYPE1|nr:uncharacterized protein HMPREF1541_09704 [Cyphellophora europaea CBS 101466]ETN44829.1 hypothetical protein HMPREF1541_09704 [Cyphellophora europaea CBS 101466]